MSYVLYVSVMSNAPTSISDLINKWPTIGDFADEVGCGYEAARQMRLRESINPKHWESVVAASQRRKIKGVTFKWLASQRAAKERASA